MCDSLSETHIFLFGLRNKIVITNSFNTFLIIQDSINGETIELLAPYLTMEDYNLEKIYSYMHFERRNAFQNA